MAGHSKPGRPPSCDLSMNEGQVFGASFKPPNVGIVGETALKTALLTVGGAQANGSAALRSSKAALPIVSAPDPINSNKSLYP